ncbi:MAG: LAGLIDADG family homing endonuclease [Candidatus Aenigmatarchaeota archaeon]
MKVIADFHIHSFWSRATSKQMNLDGISDGAKIKGLNLVGTGDFTHPKWFDELRKKLKPVENSGLFEFNGILFTLTSEVATYFEVGGMMKRVHHVIHAPSFDVVNQINEALKKYGDLASDGRPILNLSATELVEILTQISNDILIYPAHAWTPWMSCFGSKSGFNSMEECYQDQAKHIYALETGMSCYDGKTEVLTSNGWKKISRVKKSDEICTLDPKTNEIKFQKPKEIFSYKYKGKMYRLKTKRVDLFVTPNHKLFVSKCDFHKQPKFFLKEAEFLFNKSKRFKKDGIWVGNNTNFFVLPSVKIKYGNHHYKGFRVKKEKKIPIKPWLKFFGFWLAEGWTTEGKNGDYCVYIANSNKSLISEMQQILKSFGYNPYLYTNKGIETLRIRDYQLFHYLKQFGKSSDRFVPKEIKSLQKGLLEIFFNYYIKGDGHIYGRKGRGLSAITSSTRLRDDLQEIALKIGISAYYKLHKKKGTLFLSPGYKYSRKYKQKKDTWVVYFIRKNIHTVLPSAIKKNKYIESWVDFNGKVFCVSVPNQVIYIRRNGIPVWCGNSDPAMNWRLSDLDRFTLVSNSDSHSPWSWRLGREANVFDLKKITYWEIFDAIKNKDKKSFLYTIEVDPNYGKYHFTGHRNCNVVLHPRDAIKLNNICPKCHRKLTVGVLQRVEELADRPEGFVPKDAIPFKTLLPLYEIISFAWGSGELYSKKVLEEHNKLIEKFGNELNVLLNVPKEELVKVTNEKIANAIIKVREGKVKYIQGADGRYGQPIFDERIIPKQSFHYQKNLTEF